MTTKEEEILKSKKWAVVGATENPDKYGYKIYMKLKNKGYTVYAVNPNYTEIDGDKCFPNLTDLPETPDVIDMVVAPRFGMRYVEQAAEAGISTYGCSLELSVMNYWKLHSKKE